MSQLRWDSPFMPTFPTIYVSTYFAAIRTTGLGDDFATSSSLLAKAGMTVTVPSLLKQSKTNVE
ncbi:hypothetical protein, partial [Klebsiella pneumoniae]|uniref:hypothetical protein n=1 Tax=Klebsiella pneumoniae TaxID=573 RepID=UPI003D36E040